MKDVICSNCFIVKVFDRNSDGYISKLELHKTMIDLGIDLSREDLDVMMEEADINKDGRIDYAGYIYDTSHFILYNELRR